MKSADLPSVKIIEDKAFVLLNKMSGVFHFKRTHPPELMTEILNDLIDKIIVHAPNKNSGHRKHKIEIYYKAVDNINIATNGKLSAKNGRSQWYKQKQSA